MGLQHLCQQASMEKLSLPPAIQRYILFKEYDLYGQELKLPWFKRYFKCDFKGILKCGSFRISWNHFTSLSVFKSINNFIMIVCSYGDTIFHIFKDLYVVIFFKLVNIFMRISINYLHFQQVFIFSLSSVSYSIHSLAFIKQEPVSHPSPPSPPLRSPARC